MDASLLGLKSSNITARAMGYAPSVARSRMLTTSFSRATLPSSYELASAKRLADSGVIPTSPTCLPSSMLPLLATAILDGCALGFSPGRFGTFAISLLFRRCLSDVRMTQSSNCVATCSFGGRLAAPRTGTSSPPSSPISARWRSAWLPRYRLLLLSLTRPPGGCMACVFWV